MLLDGANPPSVRGPQHHGTRIAPPAAAAEARSMALDLMEGLVAKPEKLDLTHRLQAVQRHANRRAYDASLGQRGIDHPIGAELVQQTFSHPKDPAIYPDILP